ncbi:MAG: protein-export chaperone SecB [Cellvibrionales bacterium]|nr:protein-export chaperone SecB [Cellvibrionales bacterium]
MPTENERAATTESTAIQFGIERIYIKGLSLECPQGARAFAGDWQPGIDLDINTRQTRLGDGRYELVLRLKVRTRDSESGDTLFLAEIHQAGLFRIKGASPPELQRLLATAAPTALFPYAREASDSLAVRAGFPPLNLAPINFDALLAEAMEEQRQAEQATNGHRLQ